MKRKNIMTSIASTSSDDNNNKNSKTSPTDNENIDELWKSMNIGLPNNNTTTNIDGMQQSASVQVMLNKINEAAKKKDKKLKKKKKKSKNKNGSTGGSSNNNIKGSSSKKNDKKKQTKLKKQIKYTIDSILNRKSFVLSNETSNEDDNATELALTNKNNTETTKQYSDITAEEFIKHHQRYINLLGADNMSKRKDAILKFLNIFINGNDNNKNEILRPTDDVCMEIYEDMMKPLLKRFADKSEYCRLGSIKLINFFLSLTLDMAPTLPYLYPVITERSSTSFGYDEEGKEFVRDPTKHEDKKRGKALKTEIQEGMVYKYTVVEPSEEVRLELMKLLKSIVVKILNSAHPTQLGPYFTDTILLVAVGICDPYPELKLESYDLICELATKVPPGTKHFAEGFIKLIMPSLGHRHSKIRLAALHAIDRLIQCPDEMKRKGAGTGAFTSLIGHRDENVLPIASFYHGESRVNYFAKIVVDNSIQVRVKFAECLGMWLHDLPDRYDYFSRILPYMLSCLSDEAPQVAELALRWVEKCGKQWEEEHDKDVIERRQYGVDGAKTAERDIVYPYPFKGRPRLGCRLFVRGHCRRFLKPLMNELGDWKDKTRVHAARLLRVCLVYMEEHITQHLHELIGCFCRSALYEFSEASVSWMPECVRIVSKFVEPKPLLDLLLPVVTGQIIGGSAVKVPLRSSRSQALAVLGPVLSAVSAKRLFPHVKEIIEALCTDELIYSREVGERRRHFNAAAALVDTLYADIDKATTVHFERTGRLVSLKGHIKMLKKAIEHMHELVIKDINNHIAGGDKLLKAADTCKDKMDQLLNKMGLTSKRNNNNNNNTENDDVKKDAKNDDDDDDDDDDELVILNDDDIDDMMEGGDVE